MTLIQVSRSGETVLIPPCLPDYLSAIHDLKPIMGKPADEDVKSIHTVMRALNAVAHVPTLYDHDLAIRLSQHLFGVQMAVYRVTYSTTILPGDRSVYVPPALPSHIPGILREVVGVPSEEEIKLAHGALRSAENLVISPHLFDANLSMKLSQHFFNLQFARYMHDSAAGCFVSESEPEELQTTVAQPNQGAQKDPSVVHENSELGREGQSIPLVAEAEQAPHDQESSELVQLGETIVKAIKDVASESKDVLDNMNRVLMLIKRDQSTVGCVDKYYQVFKNPLNQEGIAASEYGLPQLRYEYINDGYRYHLWMSSDHIARYLKFFGIGSDMIQDGEEPKLINGKEGEAGKLILAQLGVTRP
ncbi:unnamed protein product [Rhizoctonia solani]|uniref:Laminin domain protein n=1 Tax=Rhizoctonia solani TaxID=456999 RepID=A0A8H3HFK5_9AGAM|nr:unnamed protein product [Rhizoctonia solani]